MADEPIRCACGRTLRDPVSVARRMGPVCWRKRHPPPVKRRTVVRVPARSAGAAVEQMELWEVDGG